MRVIAGRARGTKLYSIDLPSARPTLDRVKESIFSTIQFNLKDKICLDAFSCTGSLGIEALSRGAAFVDFCERDKETFSVLKKNIEKTKLIDKSSLHNVDVFDFIKSNDASYDFVFADPPYNKNLVSVFIEQLLENQSLNQGGLIVAEHEKSIHFDAYDKSLKNQRVVFLKKKEFSDTCVSYFKVANV